jgi:hypothetical protein
MERPGRAITRHKTAWAVGFHCQACGRVAESSCVPFAAQLPSGHLVGGFIGISRRNKPGLLLLPAAAVAKLDLVYFHGNNSPNWPLLRFTAFGSAHRGYGAGRFAGRAAIESPMRICRRCAPKSSIRVD